MKKGKYIKCLVCKKMFYIFPSEHYNKNRRYCSRKCMGIALSGNKNYFYGKHYYGSKHPLWKGGISHNGKYLTNLVNKDGKMIYAMQHRLVIEKHLKRYLKCEEIIHHINGDFSDNRIENLLLCKNKSEHLIIHDKMEKLIFNMIKHNKIYFDFNKKDFFERILDTKR